MPTQSFKKNRNGTRNASGGGGGWGEKGRQKTLALAAGILGKVHRESMKGRGGKGCDYWGKSMVNPAENSRTLFTRGPETRHTRGKRNK